MFKNRREPNRNEQRNLQNSPHGPSNSQFTSGTTNVEFARESRFNKPRENQSRQRNNNNNNNQNVDRVEFAREFDDDCCDRSSRDDRSERDTPNEGESLEARDRNDSPYYDVT